MMLLLDAGALIAVERAGHDGGSATLRRTCRRRL